MHLGVVHCWPSVSTCFHGAAAVAVAVAAAPRLRSYETPMLNAATVVAIFGRQCLRNVLTILENLEADASGLVIRKEDSDSSFLLATRAQAGYALPSFSHTRPPHCLSVAASAS